MTQPTNLITPEGAEVKRSGHLVLVVDDEKGILQSLERTLQREGIHSVLAENGEEALEILRSRRVGVLLTDLMMPKTNGMDLLRAAKAVSPETEVILMTAYGTVETAVEAMKEGAYDFVTKPLKRAHVVRSVKNALEKQSLLEENRNLKAQLAERKRKSIIGTSLAWRRTMDIVMQAAPSEATCLLLGESGTGKELLARAIHDHSHRADKPFVAVNCAAIPESILESELFGYVKGAFTGASASREGRFEAASGGTLFLDEIGELPKHIQVKLLRVLQESEIERLGDSGRVRSIDIRVVAATNIDLEAAVADGTFREDLYYRLNVVSLAVPALRERRDDIPLLAQHFLSIYAAKNGKSIVGLTQESIDLLAGHSWPGNVRELENTIERAVVLTRSDWVEPSVLPEQIKTGRKDVGHSFMTFPIGMPLQEIEMNVILETLRHTGGDKRLAAKLLGIATRTIYRRLENVEDSASSGFDKSGDSQNE